jgi:hypothetical protein
MMAAMDASEFTRFLRRFLPTARRAPLNYAAVLAPVVTLVGLSAIRAGRRSSSRRSGSRLR